MLFQVLLLPWLPVEAVRADQPQHSVPVIIDEIGKLEGVRDPKCYATASRLEDFIYGTPLEPDARFKKVALQKDLIRRLWIEASTVAQGTGKTRIDADLLRPLIQGVVPYAQQPNGDWAVSAGTTPKLISARDKRQYGSIAYALRAVLAVQQEALLDSGAVLLPLEPPAVELLKEMVDLATLAALQLADFQARLLNRDRIGTELLQSAWLESVKPSAEPAGEPKLATPAMWPGSRFATIRAIVDKKIEAYAAYNNIAMPLFLRNLQVYFARYGWPSDPGEGKAFKDTFTEAMIAFTSSLLLEAEKRAKMAERPLISVEDVHYALQVYEPHELNAYEDVIYFPRLPREERIIIEAFDLDAFRDPGIHWVYLDETLKDPKYPGALEPDPFAAELLVEGTAQFGVLVLRIAGMIAKEEQAPRLGLSHLTKSLARIQALLDRHAQMPEPKQTPAGAVVSAPAAEPTREPGAYFTDVTTAAGITFEHRLSDWLNRRIRGYTVKDGEKIQLAVPPAFGGSGVAAEDIDNDGDSDILILGGAGNVLYLNEGNGTFKDVTEEAGLAWKRPDGLPGEPRQPIVADFDNDGLQDILITFVDDQHRLYRNLGRHQFEDVTARAGLAGKGLVGGPATAIDFDEDGLLDLYIGYFGDYLRSVLPTLARHNTNGLPNKLYRNKGGFQFEDVTAGSGVDNLGWAQSIGHADFDGDGREDLICGNDFGVNAYYRNLGNGKFEDVAAQIGAGKPSYTMNVGITDLNRDGYPDIYISNIVTMNKDEKYVLPDAKMPMKFSPEKLANMRVVEANDLLLSVAEPGGFKGYELSKAVERGLKATGWAWDADFFDFDNDGDDDLYVVNGMNEYAVYSSLNPYFTDAHGVKRDVIVPVSEKEVNVFFVNRGGKLAEESKASGADLLGNSRSVAYLDYDADGDLDMILNNLNSPAVLYRNNSERVGNHWLKLRLIGNPDKQVTRDAIGAKILVDSTHAKGLWREVFSTIGYLSAHPKEQHFGLGPDTKADITVVWPNGEKQQFADVTANRAYRLAQGEDLISVAPR